MSRITKRFLAAAAAVAVLLVGGCASILPSASRPGDADCLHAVIERGTLRVGMSGRQPPLNMKNAAGELVGLDVDLARALAESMDVELVLVERPFATLLDRLERGEVDLVISSLTITPARNARVAFAGPYLISGSALITRAGLAGELDRIGRLDSAERTWAALDNSTGKELIVEAFPLARFVAVEDQEAALPRIAAGEVDGLVADLPFVEYALLRHPELELATLPAPFTTEPLGVALPADSPLFANLVQNYLNTLEYTGRLMQMKARWMSEGDWLGEMP